MAFVKNLTQVSYDSGSASTTNTSSAGDSSVDDKPLKCDKKTCRFNIEGDKCSLEFCFYDDTEYKLHQETFEYECQICGTKKTGDAKAADMRICDDCLKHMREMGTVKECKLCSRSIDPKKISLWGTGICDTCSTRLKSVMTKEKRRCPLCNAPHTSTTLPLTNICNKCMLVLRKLVKPYRKDDDDYGFS